MKVEITSPLHVAEINGKKVRFFRTPLKDGKPDFPWHAVNDLASAMGLNSRERKGFLRMLRSGPGAVVVSIATEGGIAQISPHFMAQGLVEAMVETGHAAKVAEDQYHKAVFDAGKALELVDGRCGSFEYTLAAFRRWDDESASTEARP